MEPQVYSMSSYLVAPGLRFNDCVFSEPLPFAEWLPPACAGVVAVLARDPNWAPKPFRPLYFGEFGNDARRSQGNVPLPTAAGNLFIAVLPMPFSTAVQRRALRHELVAAYNPICQAQGTPSSDELARKLDEIESRQQEQNAQIVALLAHFTKLFEPQPASPRRPIGFMPQPLPAAAQTGLSESGS